jgi:L-amino acid N-acyltransferase YncA
MRDVSIRPSGPGDIAAITRIYAGAVEHGTASFEIEPPGEAEMARRQQALLAGRYPYLVAERAGRVAGYAYAGPYRARPAYRWSVEDSIYIAPEFHRQRIGSALLARLIEEAQLRGFRQMIAVIGDSTQTASIALHAAAGFALVGTLRSVGFKHGRWLDTVLMQRPLGSADAMPP